MTKLLALSAVCLLSIGVQGCTVPFGAGHRIDLSDAVLAFSDEFEGDTLDTGKWNIISRILYSNNALNAYNPSMVSVSGGYLRLDIAEVPYLGRKYSAGEIDTRDKFSQQYGYFEARIKVPSGAGLHSSWWLWPASDHWPPEIDIMEVKGNDRTTVYMTLHWAENGIVRAFPEQLDFTGDHFVERRVSGKDFSQDFHVFGLEWSPQSIAWYIDGIEWHRTDQHIPHEPFLLELDLALDAYGGALDASTILPASLLVDYVRVYSLPGDRMLRLLRPGTMPSSE